MKKVTGVEYANNPQKSIFSAMSLSAQEKVKEEMNRLLKLYPKYKDDHGLTRTPPEVEQGIRNYIFSELVHYKPETNTYLVL